MKNYMRVISLMVALSMMLSAFAGCGGDSKKSKKTGEKFSAEAGSWEDMFGEEYVNARKTYEAENPPYNIPENLKGTTVKFATWIDHTGTEASQIMANFQKDTGIAIEWIQIPQGTYLTQLSTLVASGQSPDVYVENNEFFPMTLQLSKPLDEVASIDLKDPIWDQGYIDFATFGNHTYQLNSKNSIWNCDNLVYYSKKAFEENGLMTPQDYIDAGEWTVENMINIMREFDALGDSYTGGSIDPDILAGSNGSGIVYMKNKRFVSGLKENALQDAFKTYLNVLDEGINDAHANVNLVKGTTGLYMVSTYGLKPTGFFKGVEPDVLGFAPIPSDSGIVSCHYRAYGILSASQNPEGAGYFLRYFLDPYNYDWNSTDTFISEEARDYFIEYVCSTDFSKKSFTFDKCMTALLGYSGHDDVYKWCYTLMRTDAAQLGTAIDSISGEVNTAIEKANKILAEIEKQ